MLPARPAIFLCVALAPASMALPATQTWYESYHEAEKAIAAKDWNGAVRYLDAALKENPKSGTQVRTYGMRFIDYYPFLDLGVAYYNLGQVEAALQALDTEERQGEIARSPAALARLRSLREQIERDRKESEAARKERVDKVVRESTEAAGRLEREGKIEDSLAALDRALAVAPDREDIASARKRLLEAAAQRARSREAEERFAALLARGRSELDAGSYAAAAATLEGALAIKKDEQASALLRKAMAGIAPPASVTPEDARQRRIDEGLRLARELEAEEAASRAATVKGLVDEARRLLATGDNEAALRTANRVLALEPSSAEALECLARGYAALSKKLLGGGRRPPAIVLDDRREERTGAGRVETVRSPPFSLTGTVYHDAKVLVTVERDGMPAAAPRVQEREFQGLWVTGFRFETRLAPGLASLRVRAIDQGGVAAEEAYAVAYVPPFYRARWLQVASAAAALALLAMPIALRRWRRRMLLERRFNPYVAGAPIVDADRYYGRERLLDYVLRRIQNNSILLYGERRIGKTSFQHQLKRRLRELDDPTYRYFAVFIDLQGTPERRFFATLAEEIWEELASDLGDLQMTAAAQGEEYGHRHLVQDIQRVLKVLKGRTPKKVKLVLLIDEVDELNSYDPRVNQKLRSLFMRSFSESLVAVVSGVAIRKHWDREGSPWYNFFQEIEVEPLERAEAVKLVEAPVRDVFSFEKGVAEEILRRTRCKPYLIQRLCSDVVDQLHHEGRRRITKADVDRVALGEEA